MIHDMAQDIKTEYDNKVSHVTGAGFLQQGKTDERFKSIETEVMVMKITAAGLQAPPGYASADGGPSLRAAYGGYSAHGGCGNGGHRRTAACGDHGGDFSGTAGQPPPPRQGFPAEGGLAGAAPHARCHGDHVDRLLLDMGAVLDDVRRLRTSRAPLIQPEQQQQPKQPQQQNKTELSLTTTDTEINLTTQWTSL